jgi:hypothetical protein
MQVVASNITYYYSFPSAESDRDVWVSITRRVLGCPQWVPSKLSKMCSRHFKTEEIIVRARDARLLKGAVPSRNFPILSDSSDSTAIQTNSPEDIIPIMQLSGVIELINAGTLS